MTVAEARDCVGRDGRRVLSDVLGVSEGQRPNAARAFGSGRWSGEVSLQAGRRAAVLLLILILILILI